MISGEENIGKGHFKCQEHVYNFKCYIGRLLFPNKVVFKSACENIHKVKKANEQRNSRPFFSM